MYILMLPWLYVLFSVPSDPMTRLAYFGPHRHIEENTPAGLVDVGQGALPRRSYMAISYTLDKLPRHKSLVTLIFRHPEAEESRIFFCIFCRVF